jgi:hypothetical protein
MGGRRGKERIMRDEEDKVCCLYTYKYSIINLTTHCFKEWIRRRGWDYNGVGELVLGKLYTCMELSQ